MRIGHENHQNLKKVTIPQNRGFEDIFELFGYLWESPTCSARYSFQKSTKMKNKLAFWNRPSLDLPVSPLETCKSKDGLFHNSSFFSFPWIFKLNNERNMLGTPEGNQKAQKYSQTMSLVSIMIYSRNPFHLFGTGDTFGFPVAGKVVLSSRGWEYDPQPYTI